MNTQKDLGQGDLEDVGVEVIGMLRCILDHAVCHEVIMPHRLKSLDGLTLCAKALDITLIPVTDRPSLRSSLGLTAEGNCGVLYNPCDLGQHPSSVARAIFDQLVIALCLRLWNVDLRAVPQGIVQLANQVALRCETIVFDE